MMMRGRNGGAKSTCSSISWHESSTPPSHQNCQVAAPTPSRGEQLLRNFGGSSYLEILGGTGGESLDAAAAASASASAAAPRSPQKSAEPFTTSACEPARKVDSEGIRTPAGRAQWISSPSP